MYNRIGIDYTESPTSRAETVTTLTITLQTRKNKGWTLLRSWRDGTYIQPIPDDLSVGGWLDLDASNSAPAEAYDTVTMVLSKEQPRIKWSTPDRSDPEYVTGNTAMELPLERNKKYKANWNNNLYYNSETGTPAAVPDIWDTAKNAGYYTISGIVYALAADPPGDNWVLLRSRTKSAEVWIFYQFAVTETIYFRSRSRANDAMLDVGTLAAPGYTGNKPSDYFRWIVQSASVSEAGEDLFALTTVYGYAPYGWDPDLYNASEL